MLLIISCRVRLVLIPSGNVRRRSLLDHPNVWSDGSRVMEEVSHFECAGAGVFARVSREAWFRREWGYLDLMRLDVEDCLEQCGLQTLHRTEMWLLALQSAAAVHVDVDDLNAIRQVGRFD